jgi:hypothetical protein
MPAASRQQMTASPAGEAFSYSAEWRLIHAGNARLELQRTGEGSEARLHLRSTGVVSVIFPLDDRYVAQLGDGLCAVSVFLTGREGSSVSETKVTYDYQQRKASYLERDVKKDRIVRATETGIPACVHDVIGGVFHLRRLDVHLGDSVEIPMSDGRKSVRVRVEAQQRERVSTPAGDFDAVRYEAFVFNDVLFRRSASLFIWFSADERRLPVQIQLRMSRYAGTVTLRLERIGS